MSKGQTAWNKGLKGYTNKGSFRKGNKMSEEIKEKIRNFMRIRQKGKKNSFYGKKHSEVTKRKIGLAEKGNKNCNWNGGMTTDAEGYVHILQPTHPFATKSHYVRRSHLIVEKHLRRYLKPKEVVHHINGIRNDDRPENLKLFKNHSEHRKIHRKIISKVIELNSSKEYLLK